MQSEQSAAVRRILQVNLIGTVICLLLYGALYERHVVTSLIGGEITQVSGADFINGATFEQFARHGGQLVAPLSSSPTQAKDCKT